MDEEKEIKAKLKKRLVTLRRWGILKVHVAFSGYGDEGSIEAIVFEPPLPHNCKFDLGSFDNLMYDYLDPARVGDWVNNEGGFGTVDIDVQSGKVTGEINFNETTYSTEKLKEDQL